MAISKRAPGKLAARVKQAKVFTRKMKDKAIQEGKDFTMAYQDATGSKLDRGYKKSARIARRVNRKKSKGKVAEFRGETIDLSRRKKAISQISENLKTNLTGKERKAVATRYYKATKISAKMKANPKYAARVNANKRAAAAQANPISLGAPKTVTTAEMQRGCPQSGGASCTPGGKKSMSKKTKTSTATRTTKTAAVKKASPRKK